MITRRSLEMCSSRTLFGFAALLGLAVGCATIAGSEVQNGKPCPTRRGGAWPEVDRGLFGPSRLPSLRARPDRSAVHRGGQGDTRSRRGLHEGQEGGTIPGGIVPKWHPLSGGYPTTCPPFSSAQQRAAVDLECGKKARRQHLEEVTGCMPSPLAPAWRIWARELAGREQVRRESLFKRSIEADPWSGSIAAAHQHGADLRERLVSRAVPKRSRSTTRP